MEKDKETEGQKGIQQLEKQIRHKVIQRKKKMTGIDRKRKKEEKQKQGKRLSNDIVIYIEIY